MLQKYSMIRRVTLGPNIEI